MSFDDYTVVIYFTNFLGKPDINTFEVRACSKEEAEDLAFYEFSDIHQGSHLGTLDYETTLID